MNYKSNLLTLCLLFGCCFTIQSQTQDRKEVLNNLLQTIPSPLELSSLIQKVGIPYEPFMLNSPQYVSRYTSPYKKALNLGIYSTDLGYVNIYQKKDTSAMAYLKAIISMADGLKIESLIDFSLITQYALVNNMNGLFAETTNSFDKINSYLINNQQPELSVLILTGGWLETLHLTCQVAKNYPNKILDDRIAEQKIILDKILSLLNTYKKGAEMTALVAELGKLNDVFKKIKINQKTKGVEEFRVEQWGIWEVIIYDNEQSDKNVPKYKAEDLTKILNVSSEIRKNIVN